MAFRILIGWILTLLIIGSSQAAQTVQTSQVEFRQHQQSIHVSGQLANKAEEKLSFKISGLVSAIYVEEGQKVEAGQLLASLNKQEIDAQVEQARSVYENAVSNVNRIQALYQKNIISQDQYNNAKTQLQVAKSDLDIAVFNQKHADIRATNDGWILQRQIELNELVSPALPAFVLSNANKGWILRAAVTDKDVVRLSSNDNATISLDAYPGLSIEGVVSEIAAAATTGSGLFEVELRIQDSGLRLYSGLVGNATIETRHIQELAFVPVESIVTANGLHAELYILAPGNIASKRQVKLAFVDDQEVAIRKGLEPGDTVISLGAAYLHDGAEVAVQGEQKP